MVFFFFNKESVLGLNLELKEAQELWSSDSQSLLLGKSSTHLPKTVVWSWPSSGGLTTPGLSPPSPAGPPLPPSSAAAAKSLQSCLTLCDPVDGSPPGSPVPGILQARTLEWVAISFSNA